MEFVIGKGDNLATLKASKMNRHGIIAGATGTGKTVTLKVIAEQLSKSGIPVFLSDIKGDLSSAAKKGEVNEKIAQRVNALGLEDYETRAFPIALWDVYGTDGIPVRITVSEMGPIILSQLLGLNETQEGILNIAFKLADDEQLLLIDLKDLRAMLNYVAARADELRELYGNITVQSVGAILRSLLVLEQQGGNQFFGEPSFEIDDLFKQDANGYGVINVLASEKLFLNPKLYAAFLLWFLSELYEKMPEVGDLPAPKMVFFFDEAHVLFNHTSSEVLEKIELIIRLIRSKGISIFFVTQNPTDIPDKIGSQLGNRIQHGLRAFTPKEQKTVNAVAETFRQTPEQNLTQRLTQLEVGEAIVSFLDDSGTPTVADVVKIYPPESSFSPLDALEKQQIINQSEFYDKYADAIDRESAHEQLNALNAQMEAQREQEERALQEQKEFEKQQKELEKQQAQAQKQAEREVRQAATRRTETPVDKLTKNIMGSVGREVGRVITRGILGMFSGKK
ncbi:DUF853 family protein [Carnobacteriaceae bacterium zg-ZUI252]|nr:DUF853 family protein [Carnobacteriaceae bacterium zg-ZUI252]MBS4770232.1 DUF853 family protein [Carnobacteriaceae bacterium zg-ZUI240]QTU83410.1 DUF853 family protein [Carnobacteriaceae bacterium zg-C25]